MKMFPFLKFSVGLLCATVAATLSGCVDDNTDTAAPYLEVAPTTLAFDEQGGSNSFTIRANRPWTVTVQDGKSWVNLSQTEGRGQAQIFVSVPASNTADMAIIMISISNAVGVLFAETVTVTQGTISAPIYQENCGSTVSKIDGSWPTVTQFTGWQVQTPDTYTGTATVRDSGDAYEPISGGNVSGAPYVVMNATGMFGINRIPVESGDEHYIFHFAVQNTASVTDFVPTFNPVTATTLALHVSLDGLAYSAPVTFVPAASSGSSWYTAEAAFTLPAGASTDALWFSFDGFSGGQTLRLDDFALYVGGDGPVLEIQAPLPPMQEQVTINEIVTRMTNSEVALDTANDHYFEAVVMNDLAGGNYTVNNLILMSQGATTAQNGLTLYGAAVDAAALGLTAGDKVRVTLRKNIAKIVIYSGMYEISGVVAADVQKLSGTVAVTPVIIQSTDLLEYQAMAVTVADVTIAQPGIWCTDTETGTVACTVGGDSFNLFIKEAAAAFVNAPYKAGVGAVSGLAAVHKNVAQLVPRTLSDVADFQQIGISVTTDLAARYDISAKVGGVAANIPVVDLTEVGVQYLPAATSPDWSSALVVKAPAVALSWSLSLSGLTKMTNYLARAYAKTASQTYYGAITPFTTRDAALTVKSLVAKHMAGTAVQSDWVKGYVAVSSTTTTGNFSNGVAILTDNDGAAYSGITIYGTASSEALTVGDYVALMLTTAEATANFGVRQYTSIAKSDISTLSSGNAISYTPLTASVLLSDYDKWQSVPAQILNANSAKSAAAGKTFSGNCTFTADNLDFMLFCRSAWAEGTWIAKNTAIGSAVGTLRGIASVNIPAGGTAVAQIVPISKSDIEPFIELAPSLMASPDQLAFTPGAGSRITACTVVNQGNYTLYAKSADTHFTTSIADQVYGSGGSARTLPTVSVTAAANTTAAPITSTITVYLATSQSATPIATETIPVTQYAAGNFVIEQSLLKEVVTGISTSAYETTEKSYSFGGYNWVANQVRQYTTGVGYLMLKSGAGYIVTPAVAGKTLKMISITTGTGASAKATVTIKTADGLSVLVSERLLGIQGAEFTMSVSGAVVGAGCRIEATSAANVQITNLVLYYQ